MTVTTLRLIMIAIVSGGSYLYWRERKRAINSSFRAFDLVFLGFILWGVVSLTISILLYQGGGIEAEGLKVYLKSLLVNMDLRMLYFAPFVSFIILKAGMEVDRSWELKLSPVGIYANFLLLSAVIYEVVRSNGMGGEVTLNQVGLIVLALAGILVLKFAKLDSRKVLLTVFVQLVILNVINILGANPEDYASKLFIGSYLLHSLIIFWPLLLKVLRSRKSPPERPYIR